LASLRLNHGKKYFSQPTLNFIIALIAYVTLFFRRDLGPQHTPPCLRHILISRTITGWGLDGSHSQTGAGYRNSQPELPDLHITSCRCSQPTNCNSSCVPSLSEKPSILLLPIVRGNNDESNNSRCHLHWRVSWFMLPPSQ
jgi:hypothetical protein